MNFPEQLLLIGREALNKLRRSKVAVFGIGGWVPLWWKVWCGQVWANWSWWIMIVSASPILTVRSMLPGNLRPP